jgi:hypothetical protein
MPGHPAGDSAPPGTAAAGSRSPVRRLAAGIRGRPQRALLGAVMSVAVLALERRLRKAVRSGGESRPAAGSGTAAGDGVPG